LHRPDLFTNYLYFSLDFSFFSFYIVGEQETTMATTNPFKALAAVRKRAGWTLNDVAYAARVSRTLIWELETTYRSGVKNATKEGRVLEAIARMKRRERSKSQQDRIDQRGEPLERRR